VPSLQTRRSSLLAAIAGEANGVIATTVAIKKSASLLARDKVKNPVELPLLPSNLGLPGQSRPQ
jgi:hypothetical protein